MIIINADDFGLDIKTNDAIVESFQKGYISSTTLMANMIGFDDACEKSKLHQLENSIGIHLNLTAGRPLSDQIKTNIRFCDPSGNFIRERKNILFLNKKDQSDISAEYSAQIQKVLSSGINPTYIDSHHHYHTEPAVLSIVCKLAIKYNIPFVRLTRNFGDGISTVKSVYKSMANHYIKNKGLSNLDYFGSVEDICKLEKMPPYKIEVMVHPTYTEDRTLIDATNKTKMSDNFLKINTKFSDMKLMSYGEIQAN